jgi:phage-related baseplate assembly protein
MATIDPSVPDYGLVLVPAIDFAEKDPAVIITEVIADYEAAFLALTNIAKSLAPGDPVRLFLLVVCQWLSHQRTLIDFTGKSNLLKYAQGDYLDNLGALYGARGLRLQAQPALTTLRFTLAATLAFEVTIPQGTFVQAANGVVFETTEDGIIPAFQTVGDVSAQAVLEGVIGNGFAPGQINSVINWNQSFAISVANTTLSSGGSDVEDDDHYRYRIWLAIESFSTCGPRFAYEFWALSAHPDIIQCVVYSAPEIAGEVWLYPLMTGGVLPTPDIMALVYGSCNADERRPVTDYVTVKVATEVPFTLNVDYYILQSNSVLLDSIQTAVDQAVADWILWQRSAISRDLICDELTKRMLEAGAKRIVIHSPTPTFQVMDYYQLVVPGQSFTDGVSVNASPTFTSATAAFASSDVGHGITGTNIPVGTTISAVTNATTITLSNNATANGSALAFIVAGRVANTVNFAGFEDI